MLAHGGEYYAEEPTFPARDAGVVETGRREIDLGPERELSIFQLGLRWMKRCLSTAIQRLPVFMVVLAPINLKPVVKAS